MGSVFDAIQKAKSSRIRTEFNNGKEKHLLGHSGAHGSPMDKKLD